MRIHVEHQNVSLEDQQDLTSLSVVTSLAGTSLSAAMGPGSLGEPDPDGEHVWLEPAALRALADGDAAWQQQFDGMLRFARGHGFMDPNGRVRAHIESSPAGPVALPTSARAEHSAP